MGAMGLGGRALQAAPGLWAKAGGPPETRTAEAQLYDARTSQALWHEDLGKPSSVTGTSRLSYPLGAAESHNLKDVLRLEEMSP